MCYGLIMINNASDQPAPEMIDVFDKDGRTHSRTTLNEALEQIKAQYVEQGESNISVPVIHVWLFRSPTPEGELRLILQERSDNHRLDKTVGGHVSAGLTPEGAVHQEAGEEMGLAVKIVSSLGSSALSDVDLAEEAALLHANHDPWQVSGRHDRSGVYYEKPSIVDVYIGVFDGNIEDLDTDFEVTKFVEISANELRQDMLENPDNYTPDLHSQLDKVLRLAELNLG